MKEHIEAVGRMQEYIAGHYVENITLADLSRVSFFSPWYSYKLFTQCTGLTVSEYIRRLRLSQSALTLRDTNCKILDVAIEMGFGSVDGYQRAFFRYFGCNPREYAQNPIPLYLFIPYRVDLQTIEKEENMDKTKIVIVQSIEKPARKAIIKRGVKATDYFTYCEEVGCDVWGLLTSMKSLSNEPVCFWLPPAYILPGTSCYVQGVEVPADYDGMIPEGFDVITLPAAKYLMFQGEPFEENDS